MKHFVIVGGGVIGNFAPDELSHMENASVEQKQKFFQEGTEMFLKELESVHQKKIMRNKWIIYKDLYKICVRFGWINLKGLKKYCFVWSSGGVDPKFQKQGFFTMLIKKVKLWCIKKNLDGILFEDVINPALEKHLLKQGYEREKCFGKWNLFQLLIEN